MCLNPGSIGVKINQKELLDAAVKHGFEAIIAMPDQLAAMSDTELGDYLAKMQEQQISWGAAGLPLDFRGAGTKFREGLSGFPARCHVLQKAGVTRMSTWIMPTNDNLTYLANFKLHTSRLKEVAKIAGYHGIKLGLEYVGPKTLMARDKYAFVHTLAEVRELIGAIDEPNMGVQLDSFHWYCAGESKADLLRLSKEDIVTVDLNDARADRTRATQLDLERELPMAAGVVDMQAFLEALVAIGYDGPVRAEPFNKALNDMGNEKALKTTAAAMKKAVSLVGG
ncbi:MAG: sugar phosphate isomerase/epimerase family protein [Bacteroidota bacterium]